MENELIKIIGPIASAPISVAIFLWWFKSHISKSEKTSEKIPEILTNLSNMKEVITEVKLEIKRLNEINDKIIINSHQIKSQWKRIDDNERRLRDGGL